MDGGVHHSSMFGSHIDVVGCHNNMMGAIHMYIGFSVI